MKARKLILFLIPTLLLSSCSVIKNLINGSEVQLDNGTMMVPEEINQQSLLDVLNNCKNKVNAMDFHNGTFTINKVAESHEVNDKSSFYNKVSSFEKVDLKNMMLYGNDQIIQTENTDGKDKTTKKTREYWSCIYDDRLENIIKMDGEYKKTSAPYNNKEEVFKTSFADHSVYFLTLKIVDRYLEIINGNGGVDQFNLNADLASSDYKFSATYTFNSNNKTFNRKEEFIIKDYLIAKYSSEIEYQKNSRQIEGFDITKNDGVDITIPQVNA